jgi:FkbM family methyltransferase
LTKHFRRLVTSLLNRARAVVFLRLEPVTPRADVESLGTHYGGWPVVVPPSAQGGVCYSGGIGEDASFDRALIERTGWTVHAFDPVPRVADYVARELADQPNFVFHPVGLWSTDTEMTFFGPELDGWVSHSAVDFRHTPAAFTAVVRSVPSLMRELGDDHLNVLKLSVEGAQFAVLDSVLSARIPVDQILVEFTPPVAIRKVRQQCARLRAAGYDLVAAPLRAWDWKCAFVRRDLPIDSQR